MEAAMHDDVVREVEKFLYREARLLDERRFHEWLDLLTEDARYWMVARNNRYPRNSKAIKITDRNYNDSDLPGQDDLAIIDDDKATLNRRIARLDTGMAWAEDPPSRTRHLITNIEVEPADSDQGYKAFTNFLVYRSRAETEQDFYVGARQDLLRRVDGALKIAQRRIILDQNVVLAKNVSIFF
jgi:3-phenylpropionate/cinnamic acid dioxygenase small subunit